MNYLFSDEEYEGRLLELYNGFDGSCKKNNIICLTVLSFRKFSKLLIYCRSMELSKATKVIKRAIHETLTYMIQRSSSY